MGLMKTARRAVGQLGVRYLPATPGVQHGLPGKLVVSLTSYPARFKTLDLTLKCLLSQSVRADTVALWVAEDAFPLLPERVLSLQAHGLTIHREPVDIGPYMKIIPALTTYSGAFIATADDDIWYTRDWLGRLVSGYRSNDEIVCLRARRIRGNSIDLSPYREWGNLDTAETGATLFPLGVSGILYPPGVLPPETLDEATFRRLSPRNDDIWLYWMAATTNRKFRKLAGSGSFKLWRGSQKIALWRTNMGGGNNDIYVRAMIDAYGIPAPLREALSESTT